MSIDRSELENVCAFCERAEALLDKRYVLCDKRGIVPSGGHCGKFIYDALKHNPPRGVSAPALEYVDIESDDN